MKRILMAFVAGAVVLSALGCGGGSGTANTAAPAGGDQKTEAAAEKPAEQK